MAGLNKVMLIGHLGADPEIKVLSTGTKLARLNLATTESYTNKSGERVQNTEWHNINVWGKLADIAEKYLTKGAQIYVEGKIRYRSYEDREGNKKYFTEIEAEKFNMLGGGGNVGGDNQTTTTTRSTQPKQQAQEPEGNDFDDNSLPF